MNAPKITAELLSALLEALSGFSAPGPGVTRLAYDDAWCDAQRWIAERARALGLATTADAAGNLYAHPRGLAAGTRAVMVGSHLDSVVQGGRYDGAYGALCGVLAAAELAGGEGGVPVVGVITAEEEGSRFSGDMLGARALLDRMRPEELDALCDVAGASWRAALAHAAARGCAAPLVAGPRPCPAPFAPSAWIEPHIEQGPVLEAEGLAIGIVEHIVGYRRVRVRVTGEARHAGTTPMRLRHDALAAAAEMILAVERAAREMGEPAVATAGQARPEPGLFNVVPGACELWVEVRHTDAAQVEALSTTITAACMRIAEARGVQVVLERTAGLEPAAMSPALVREAEALATEQGLTHRRMASGAGHDAMLFAAAGVPSVMCFVPSRGGISHSPDEHTDAKDLWTGYAFVRDLARRLQRAPEPA